MNSKTKTKLSPFIGIFSPLASTRKTPSSKHTSLHKSNALRHGIGSTNDTFCFCCRPGRKIGTREPRWEPQEPTGSRGTQVVPGTLVPLGSSTWLMQIVQLYLYRSFYVLLSGLRAFVCKYKRKSNRCIDIVTIFIVFYKQ